MSTFIHNGYFCMFVCWDFLLNDPPVNRLRKLGVQGLFSELVVLLNQH